MLLVPLVLTGSQDPLVYWRVSCFTGFNGYEVTGVTGLLVFTGF